MYACLRSLGNNTYEVGTGEHILIYGTDIFGNTFINSQRNADAFADGTFTETACNHINTHISFNMGI